MPNTDNLNQALENAKTALPGKEDNITVIKKKQTKKDVSGPCIAVNDIVVTEAMEFFFPEESYNLFGLDPKKEYYISINYTSISHASKEKMDKAYSEGFTGDTRNTVAIKKGTKESKISLGKPYLIKVKDFVAMSDNDNKNGKWVFDGDYTSTYNSDDQHTGVKFSFAIGEIHEKKFEAPGIKTEMTVLCNRAPGVHGPITVYDFREIKPYDNNKDFVPAYEVTLVNEDLINKVGLVIRNYNDGSVKTYPIGKEGLRYSADDRYFGDMKLVRLDGFKAGQDGLAANHVRIKVKACDAYAWGQTTEFHARLTDKK